MLDSQVLIGIAAVLFGLSAALYVWRVFTSDTVGRAVSSVPVLGAVALCAGIVARGMEAQRLPFTNLSGALAFTALALVVMYLAMEQRRRIGALGIFVFVLSAAALVAAILLPRQVSPALVPALANDWSLVHLGTSLTAYASLALAFGAAVGYMLQEYLLKAKRITRLQRHLPSLGVMDDLAYRMVTLGFLLLTIGIIAGVLWAQTAWHRLWDPKGTWALITWLVYAAYLHVRVVRGWRGKWSNRLLVIGFACILVTFLGVNFFSYGQHRYNW